MIFDNLLCVASAGFRGVVIQNSTRCGQALLPLLLSYFFPTKSLLADNSYARLFLVCGEQHYKTDINQTGFLKRRSIGENVRLLNSVQLRRTAEQRDMETVSGLSSRKV